MAKKWISDIVNICYEDNEPIAILRQNGTTKIHMLRDATKLDTESLLEVEHAERQRKE